MFQGRWQRLRRYVLGTSAALLVNCGASRAETPIGDADLRVLIQQQGQQIQDLKKQLEALKARPEEILKAEPVAARAPQGSAPGAVPAATEETAVKQIIANYLKENPGAGMPASVQTGYVYGQGFRIASTPDPKYANWDNECKIPFELRFRGRIQLDYYNYKTTDLTNHLNNKPQFQNANAVRQADFSQLEIKRLRLIWEGTAFDPNLRYNFTLDGNTRGLGGVQNNKVIQTGGGFDPNGSTVSPFNGGVTVDHSVRLFEGWVAYDFHPTAGARPDCPDGASRYTPTVTMIAGKLKPFFGIEEVLGSANEQMVEYSMADWFFDADDDNLLMAAGTRIKALDDRFYMQAVVTNGNESQFPNTQMDNLPGFNVGFWYDIGGTWNAEKRKWDLFGDSLSDLDSSCHPVLRVGAEANIVPMNRRSLYGDDEQSRVYVTPGGSQGGTRLINVLSGGALTPNGAHAVDEFDSYSYGTFACLHYKGFSLWNEWYFRNLNNFRTTPNGLGNIVYQDSLGNNALFPTHGLFDYGTTVQGGYFIIPKKLEVVGRFSMVRGDSGDINGDGKFKTVKIPGQANALRVYQNAFQDYHEAREFAVGVNYYFKRQLLKWQTDFSVYDGGNPSGGGTSAAGFIAGTDGWMVRTQLQLAF